MSKPPLLSVCLITYNHAQYIREAIDSALAQQVDFSWELVVADDCSTDGTREILLEYKQKHPGHIKLILQKSNVGPEQNWMDLLAYPRSKYLLYGEADDYFTDPTKLQRQVDFLEAHKDFSLCFHPVNVVYEDGSNPDELFPTPEQRAHKTILGADDLLAGNFIQTNSAMYRWRFVKEDVKKVFPKNIAPGDWYLHLLHAQVGKIGFIDRVMSVYRRHPGGIWWASHTNVDEIWQKHGLHYLNVYVELLKLYGNNAKHRKILELSMDQMFDRLISLDRKYDSTLFQEAFTNFPDYAARFSIALHRQLHTTKGALVAKEHEMAELQQTVEHTNAALRQSEREIKLMKASRLWKARDIMVRLIGK